LLRFNDGSLARGNQVFFKGQGRQFTPLNSDIRLFTNSPGKASELSRHFLTYKFLWAET